MKAGRLDDLMIVRLRDILGYPNNEVDDVVSIQATAEAERQRRYQEDIHYHAGLLRSGTRGPGPVSYGNSNHCLTHNLKHHSYLQIELITQRHIVGSVTPMSIVAQFLFLL